MNLAGREWVKITEVDTRPQGWGGQHGSFIHDDKGGLLGISAGWSGT